jgi:hypothetical protein
MLRNSTVLLVLSFILVACGGGGSGAINPISGTGSDTRSATVGVIITDASSDDFD